jgi:hypothetical protein
MQGNASSTCKLFYGKPSSKDAGKCQFYLLVILWQTQL